MINGMNIFHSSKTGSGLKPIQTRGKGLQTKGKGCKKVKKPYTKSIRS